MLANLAFLLLGSGGPVRLPRLAHPGALPLCLLLAALPWGLSSLRLHLWSRFIGHPIAYRGCLRIVLGSILAAAVTPTATGATLFKWGLIAREGVPAESGVTLVTIETVEDMLFFALVLPIAFGLGAALALRSLGIGEIVRSEAGTAVVLLSAALAALWLVARLARAGRLGRAARRLEASSRALAGKAIADIGRVFRLIARRGKGLFAFAMATTALQWTARYSVAALVIHALGGPSNPLLFGALQWLVFTFGALAPTPGGMGALEGAFALLYAPFLPRALLVPAAALWRLALFYVPLGFAAPLFLLLQRERRA